MFINKSYDLYNLAYFAFELKNKSLRPFYQNGVSMDPKKRFLVYNSEWSLTSYNSLHIFLHRSGLFDLSD